MKLYKEKIGCFQWNWWLSCWQQAAHWSSSCYI